MSVQVDLAGTYARCASAVGLHRFVVAARIEVVDAADEARSSLGALADGTRALDRAALGDIGPLLVRVVPRSHVVPVKRVDDDGEARLAVAPYTNPDGVWRWACDILAGARLSSGALAPIAEAVRLVPVGLQAGLGTVRLPSGRIVDLATEDLALAIADDRARIANDASFPEWRRRLLDGMAKRVAVAMWFGNLARIDREPQSRVVDDYALGPDGELLVSRGRTIERPGPWCSLALAGMVTACARLVVADTITRIEAAGGSWLALNTDSLLIAAVHGDAPELVPCPGGPVKVGRQRYLRKLPVRPIEEVLDRTDALLCPEGGRAWKREAGFDHPIVGYVSGVYRMALLDDGGGPSLATEPLLGGYYADPTGTHERTKEGRFRWAVEAHVAVARSGITYAALGWRGSVPDLDLPAWADRLALRPGVARTPAQLARLQRAFPERRLRPFTAYVEVVADRLRNIGPAVAIALDTGAPPEDWPALDWRNPHTGGRVELTTDPSVDVSNRVAVCTIRDVLHEWRLPRDTTTQSVAPSRSVLEPGAREPAPVSSRSALTQVCGKDGDDLVAGFIDPGAVKGADLTTYMHRYHHPETWQPWRERARALGVDELVRRGVPRRTVEYLFAGRSPRPETAVLVARAIGDADAKGVTTSGLRACARPGCGNVVTGRQRWCNPACKKAVQRAVERAELHALGAVRCRRCAAVRYGDHAGPCPACDGRAIVIVRPAICSQCGAQRIGDTNGPCPFCPATTTRGLDPRRH
jgi:hypothetical protein